MRWASGIPGLQEALDSRGRYSSFDCELVDSVDAADHILFIGAITELIPDLSRKALLWSDRSYAATEMRS